LSTELELDPCQPISKRKYSGTKQSGAEALSLIAKIVNQQSSLIYLEVEIIVVGKTEILKKDRERD